MDYNTVSNALSSALNNLGNRGNVGIGSDPLVEEAMRLSLQTSQQEERKYEELENQLVSRGLKILTVPNDGNCLFHAVALQELGSIEFHSDLRANVISFMVWKNEKLVSPYTVRGTTRTGLYTLLPVIGKIISPPCLVMENMEPTWVFETKTSVSY
eukprot:TRINITY_DN15038_c0_g1_i14.p1 TRINITY_DN15038_c0_g1~~TRINITY_DN15038_c0_g1_i14.p1  ORF type:complete len:156 (+),score=29.94 TRINITY_DN15038_c0_g1_i14:369-836(+)